MEAASTRWHRSLAARYGVVMVVFVTLGSLLVLAWLRHQQLEESRRVFVSLARNDADFVRRLNLPRSAKLAADLRQLLRLEIHFRARAGGAVEPPLPPELQAALAGAPAEERLIELPPRHQALVLPLDAAHDMLFIRAQPGPTLGLWAPGTRWVLLAFWLLSGAMAGIIGWQIVGPVRRLTRGVQGFFGSTVPALAETARRDEVGELARMLSRARDDLWRERRLRENSERLALLGRMATSLAHEIKNPLASIQLHAQLMDHDGLDAESQDSLRHLLAEVRVIEGLVNQWLYLARPAPPLRQPLEAAELVGEAVNTIRAQAAHAGVVLEAPAPPVTGHIGGDRPRLAQALRNLLLNAIQAMPRGGRLRVETGAADGRLQLRIHDAGPGFSAAALQHGTELFFSEKEGGMGVGLNVAAEIISAHGGCLRLKNHPEGGGLVEIELPLDASGPSNEPCLRES